MTLLLAMLLLPVMLMMLPLSPILSRLYTKLQQWNAATNRLLVAGADMTLLVQLVWQDNGAGWHATETSTPATSGQIGWVGRRWLAMRHGSQLQYCTVETNPDSTLCVSGAIERLEDRPLDYRHLLPLPGNEDHEHGPALLVLGEPCVISQYRSEAADLFLAPNSLPASSDQGLVGVQPASKAQGLEPPLLRPSTDTHRSPVDQQLAAIDGVACTPARRAWACYCNLDHRVFVALTDLPNATEWFQLQLPAAQPIYGLAFSGSRLVWSERQTASHSSASDGMADAMASLFPTSSRQDSTLAHFTAEVAPLLPPESRLAWYAALQRSASRKESPVRTSQAGFGKSTNKSRARARAKTSTQAVGAGQANLLTKTQPATNWTPVHIQSPANAQIELVVNRAEANPSPPINEATVTARARTARTDEVSTPTTDGMVEANKIATDTNTTANAPTTVVTEALEGGATSRHSSQSGSPSPTPRSNKTPSPTPPASPTLMRRTIVPPKSSSNEESSFELRLPGASLLPPLAQEPGRAGIVLLEEPSKPATTESSDHRAWLQQMMGAQLRRFEQRMNERVDTLEANVDARLGRLQDSLDLLTLLVQRGGGMGSERQEQP
ncbi:uncharacterized protein MONBRDRAFT_36360 [Monosiga brevicollis MX1]|uniref:Uncharacterized protein n=1 Tax=Monosiga brevicollis TaxID=81824 RepID=A9UV69_MONBE|nr:uncharacterized protein MONBRDRAFT_36360 [Monosiga brevicollis MX1]EDQ91029.1 predicted protein [Monosiga brevicollis MX1]|eukprot:XP_001744326.1 hypothetical protein [Monosiga brevicollis MX1]